MDTDAQGYEEIIRALEFDGQHLEHLTADAVEKIDRMLDDDPFDRTHLERIRSLARESVVNVPNLDERPHLVIKCNERLEALVERVKHEAFVFTENAEKMRSLIDLNVLNAAGLDCQRQETWKNELVDMQGQVSSDHMDILAYYRRRSAIGIDLLHRPRVSDYWMELLEIDEDFFFKLRTILYHLKLYNVRLHQLVYRWLHVSKDVL